jgi:hypothetical protein
MRELLILSTPIGIRRESVDFGLAFMKRPVLALELE